MNSTFLLLAKFGFAALTIVYAFLFLKLTRAGIHNTTWESGKKQKVFNWLCTGLIIWFVFVGVWSISGRMGNFSVFPLNFMPVIVIPLVTIVTLTIFSKNLAEILAALPISKVISLQHF